MWGPVSLEKSCRYSDTKNKKWFGLVEKKIRNMGVNELKEMIFDWDR